MKARKQLNRRDFIKLSSIASASLPIALSGFPIFAQEASQKLSLDEENENILVLIQLQGGNDGLNTIFDLNDYDDLQSVRSNIIIPENELIAVNDSIMFHPSLEGLQGLWNTEQLGIIQNVGYPDQNRSHFRSTDIWNSASSSNEFVSSGWIGRYFDLNYNGYPELYPNDTNPHPFAITIGRVVSETCQGVNANFSMAIEDPENPGTASVSNMGDLPDNCYGNALDFVNTIVKQTNAYAEVITEAADSGNTISEKYTNTNLSEKLKQVARLISGGLQTKVYVVQIGGFDNHDNQVVSGNPSSGIHSELLRELSDAIAAFQEDLDLLNISDRVIGMTYSEFGRRIRSNGGNGTDHGSAAPLFLFGNCAKNQILGDSPEIDRQVSINEGVQMQFDFRTVYRTILTDWLGATSSEASSVLFGDFNALPLFKNGCNAALSTDDLFSFNANLQVFPNPTSSYIDIKFLGTNEQTSIKLYNTLGAVIKIIANKRFNTDIHILRVDLSDLEQGNYFVHFQSGSISKTKKVLKI